MEVYRRIPPDNILECSVYYRKYKWTHENMFVFIAGNENHGQTKNTNVQTIVNSSWTANANTLKISSLAVCYSTGEHTCPVWGRSLYAKNKIDVSLNEACRLIIGRLRPTSLPKRYELTGIALLKIRWRVAAKMNGSKHWQRQSTPAM